MTGNKNELRGSINRAGHSIRYTLAFVLGAGAVAVSCQISRAPVSWPEIRSERFVLSKTGSGVDSAVLSIVKDKPVLTMRSSSGSWAEITPESVKLMDKDGNGRAALVLGDKGPILIFAGEPKKVGFTLETNVLKLRDDDGHLRAVIGAVDQGAGIMLLDQKERARLLMMTSKSGSVGLNIMNERQKVMWSTP